MSARLHYFHDHTHDCECGGWSHEAIDCDLPRATPCPMCDLEEGLTPMTNGTKLMVDPWDAHVSIAGPEEVYL